MTPPTVQFIPAAGGPDWDTYADGIWEVIGWRSVNPGNATSQTQIAASSTFTMPSEGFYNSSVRSRYHSDATTATAPQYVAVWDVTNSSWHVKGKNNDFGSSGAYIWQFGTLVYGSTLTMVDFQDYVFVYLTQDPGGITGWTNYA